MTEIILKDIFKSYDQTEVIHGVDLKVESGKFLVLVGPSGCGKSTLLRIIAGLERITSGEILIDGNEVSNIPASERGLAMVFQSYALYPHMSVFKNMAFALENLKIDKNLKLKKNWSQYHLVDQSIRNSISNYIIDASDEDWIIISDIDEFPNPDVIQNFDKRKKYSFFEQQLFYYKFNLKCVSEPLWYGSRLCIKKYLKSPQWLRNIKVNNKNNFFKKIFNNQQILNNGGWHFSSVKKPSELITKLKSFAHNELVKKYMLNETYIKNKINNYEDIFERGVILEKVELNNDFPEYLLKNRDKYSEFII